MLDAKQDGNNPTEQQPRMTAIPQTPVGLAVPTLQLGIGLTGHRDSHPVFSANRDAIAETLGSIFAGIDAIIDASRVEVAPCPVAKPRLHSLLAYGADLMSVKVALSRGWDVVAPLPFGLDLNIAVNAQPQTADDVAALLASGEPADPLIAARAEEIRSAAAEARLFALAEQDDAIAPLLLAKVNSSPDQAPAMAFDAAASARATIAARIMIEQSDLMIGVWDGVTKGASGGTRHTIEAALELGVPVIWIDARQPAIWHLLATPESMAALPPGVATDRMTMLERVVRGALIAPEVDNHGVQGDSGLEAIKAEKWRPKSSPWFQAYRAIEQLFGGDAKERWARLSKSYESPGEIVDGSAAAMLNSAQALGGDERLREAIAERIVRPFAWADGVSTWLSDAYRGSMVTSFLLSALAIIGGVAYLPLATIEQKWAFALFEFILLLVIVGLTFFGRRWRWHSRWFETRRVAEYFRHAPILLMLGVTRSVGRWPTGPGSAWPEWYARHVLRGLGLPAMSVTSNYLRQALMLLRDHHVLPQRDYHRAKAARLKLAQGKIDRLSEILFVLAVLSVALYLSIEVAALSGLIPRQFPHDTAKTFTFLGVLLPTLGGGFAGIHYFGDFERFAAISEIAATKLDAIADRANTLLAAPDGEINYARVSSLAHSVDESVIAEIESWQAVFGGKHITVPV